MSSPSSTGIRSAEPSLAEVRRHLSKLLPREALRPRPIALLYPFLQLLVMLLAARAIGMVDSTWARLGLGLVLGHSMACQGFFAHHLSHGAFLRGGRLLPVLESVVWACSFGSGASWRVYHNGLHHRREGTLDDSNRYFTTEEITPTRKLYALLILPNRVLPWNPLVLLLAMMTTRAHALGGLLSPHKRQPGIVTNLGEYDTNTRLRVALDLTLGVAIQVGLFSLSGLSLLAYAAPLLVAFLTATAVGSFYLQTQHALYPVTSVASPLNATSLRVPRLVDWLHAQVSHHTAHHLFEAIAPAYLPLVTELLEVHYPWLMDRRTPFACWREMFKNPVFKAPPLPTGRADVETDPVPVLAHARSLRYGAPASSAASGR